MWKTVPFKYVFFKKKNRLCSRQQPMHAVVLVATADSRCTSGVFNKLRANQWGASVVCGSTDAPLNHKFSSRVHAVGAQCKQIALGRRASYCTLITSTRAQAAARQGKMAALFSFIRGSGAAPLADTIRMCAAVLLALRDHYGFLWCIPGLMAFTSRPDLQPVSFAAVH